MSVSEFSAPLAGGVRSMVHRSVRNDPLRAAFHESFILTRLLGGAAAFAAFPVYLALWGAPDPAAVVAFVLLVAPVAAALYLSRTGRLENAQIMSALGLAALVTFLAALTGGPQSALLAWLLVLPAEAALSGSRKSVVCATGIAAASVVALVAGAVMGTLPAPMTLPFPAWAWPVFGALPAAIYAGALAVRTAEVARGLSDAGLAAEARARAVLDHGPDVVIRLRRNGNVTFAADAAPRVMSAAPDELAGDGLYRRIHVADRPAWLAALDAAGQGADAAAEFRLQRGPDQAAGFLWVEMRARALPGTDEIVASLRDATARKAAEADLGTAREEAERASLAKSRFLARMSHEVRTPLNAILGFSEMLGQDLERPGLERQREYAGLIADGGRHLLDLVNDILDLSRIEAGSFDVSPEPVDLAPLVADACALMEPAARKAGLTLATDLSFALPTLHADRRACRQILINLMQNAVKFSRPGGSVVVGAFVEGAEVCVYVADEGVGIARAELPRLGQPFVRLDAGPDCAREGTGLGLSVVKGLAEAHGGRMEIESEPGIGTRVTVRIPFAVADQPEAPAEPLRLSA